MIKVYCDFGNGDQDITVSVIDQSIHIEDRINQPTLCTFIVANLNDTFVSPKSGCYVRIYSQNFDKNVFTGFVTNEPVKTYLGGNPKTPNTGYQQHQYQINCTSDEYLLNVHAVEFLPAFSNQTAGSILANLANALVPDFFDTTSFVASGDIIPYFKYDPTKSWSDYAKNFADSLRYRYKVINRVIYFQPWGDQSLGVIYDETGSQAMFDPRGIQLSVQTVPPVNDAIVIGDTEAGNIHRDYFIGTGFDGSFPLRHTPFEDDTTLLLQEDWTQSTFSNQWTVQDFGGHFQLAGALNVIGGNGFDNDTFIEMTNGLELGGKLDLQTGEIQINDICNGIVGGIFNKQEIISKATCEAGFYLLTGNTLNVTASGAGGVLIQPYRLGNYVSNSFQITSKPNHHYVFRILIDAKRPTRYNRLFRTLGSQNVGGDELDSTGDITWEVQDIDMGALIAASQLVAVVGGTNPIPVPLNATVYRYTLQNVELPSFAWYAPIDDINLNITLNLTTLNIPPQGTLTVQSLTGASGSQLPIAPANIGQPLNYALGYGGENQTATIGKAGSAFQLQFYGDTIPAPGAKIEFQTWESQAAIGRVRDDANIATTGIIRGDDGVRLAVLSNLSPLPRTSEECELAALAAINDKEGVQYQGNYTFWDTFLTPGFKDYPRSGEYLLVNAPYRNVRNQNFIAQTVTMQISTLIEEHIQFTVQFGSDTYLERILATFLSNTDNIIIPKDAKKQPTPIQIQNVGLAYADDLIAARLSKITGSAVTCDLGVPSITGCEVRRTDAGWGGRNNQNLIGSFNTQTFILPRNGYEQIWYVRQVNGSKYSRRSTVLRINYPTVPQPPLLISADSSQITLDFADDIRNIRFTELRDVDNTTVLFQQTFTTPADLVFDLTQLTSISGRTFYAYFVNLQWEYSAALPVIIPIPTAPVLTLGTKFASYVDVRLDRINRNDIIYTTYQLSQDSGFVTNVISVTGSGQPPMMSIVTPNSAGNAYFARCKRADHISDGPWSGTLNIPYGNLIASSWSVGQGSIPPTLDNQVTALFSYTSSANAGGGANSARIVITWVAFSIVYADTTQQAVASGNFDTGTTLTSSTSSTTPYIFYSRLQANIAGSLPEFVGGAHSSNNVNDAQACVTDGYIPLGGKSLGITLTVPQAPTSGGPSGGGGSDGGSACIPDDEVLHTNNGDVLAADVRTGIFVESEDPETFEHHWSIVEKYDFFEELCFRIELEDGSQMRCSKSTVNAVWIDGKLEYKKPVELTGGMKMKSRKNGLQRVKSVEEIGMLRVAAIRLSPFHNFYAGDILSHNFIAPKRE